MERSSVEAFRSNGAIVQRGLFDPRWMETLRRAATHILDHAHAPGSRLRESRSYGSDGMWRSCEPFARFLFESPIGSAAATAMSSRAVRLYEDLFLYTEPGVEGATWHRDAPHWPVRGDQLSSIWFSLEAVTSDTGALRFVAGSHRDGDEVTTEGMYPVVEDAPGDRPILSFETEPGDAVIFHPRILHSANGSAPTHPRRTFTIRFAGDDVRWRPRSAYYHPWMADSGLQKGDVLDHPWFPVVPSATDLRHSIEIRGRDGALR